MTSASQYINSLAIQKILDYSTHGSKCLGFGKLSDQQFDVMIDFPVIDDVMYDRCALRNLTINQIKRLYAKMAADLKAKARNEALLCLAVSRYYSEDILSLFSWAIDEGFNLNVTTDDFKNNVLFYALVNEIVTFDQSGLCEPYSLASKMALLLTKAAFDWKATDVNGRTIFSLACAMRATPFIKNLYALSENNPSICNIDTMDKYGNTPLHYLCLTGNIDIFNMLDSGNVRKLFKQKNHDQKTPFDLLSVNLKACSKMLESVGIDVNRPSGAYRNHIYLPSSNICIGLTTDIKYQSLEIQKILATKRGPECRSADVNYLSRQEENIKAAGGEPLIESVSDGRKQIKLTLDMTKTLQLKRGGTLTLVCTILASLAERLLGYQPPPTKPDAQSVTHGFFVHRHTLIDKRFELTDPLTTATIACVPDLTIKR